MMVISPAPCSVSSLLMITCSSYVPAATLMVSPSLALFIADCIGVSLALKVPPSPHHPVSLTFIISGLASTPGIANSKTARTDFVIIAAVLIGIAFLFFVFILFFIFHPLILYLLFPLFTTSGLWSPPVDLLHHQGDTFFS